jgi:hypothetical protein
MFPALVRLVVLSATIMIMVGCEGDGTCAGVGKPGVRAHIRDSVSGAPLGYRSTLIVREGTYIDSVPYRHSPLDSATIDYIDAANGRAGTYSVTIRREGSRVWTRTGVRAEIDGCDFDNAEFTVRLQPAG